MDAEATTMILVGKLFTGIKLANWPLVTRLIRMDWSGVRGHV